MKITKNKRTVGFIIVMLFTMLMINLSVFALSPLEELHRIDELRDYVPEFTSGYDSIYINTANGYGKRIYEPGGLFT